jgi:GTP-binding protein
MGENLNVRSVRFVTSAVQASDYPDLAGMPEIAVAGRSNVGKSSLINGLVNRRQLARVSNTPGRTQLLNFFVVNEHFGLCDLPGYGFAAVPGKVKAGWGRMIETYLTSRTSLRALLLLIDVRREPGQWETDLVHWCSVQGHSVVPVVTKVDKLNRARRGLAVENIAKTLGFLPRKVIAWSTLSGEGMEPLWQAVMRQVGPPPGSVEAELPSPAGPAPEGGPPSEP